jgi:hypothetical protein
MAGNRSLLHSELPFEEHFLGSAKVKLANLKLGYPQGRTSVTIQKSKIDKLIRRFKKSGCNRLHRPNHIGALISREMLAETLSKSKYGSIEQLKITPLNYDSATLDLPQSVQLLYYDGQARLEAIREYRPGALNDHWWVVDFYDQSKYAIY